MIFHLNLFNRIIAQNKMILHCASFPCMSLFSDQSFISLLTRKKNLQELILCSSPWLSVDSVLLYSNMIHRKSREVSWPVPIYQFSSSSYLRSFWFYSKYIFLASSYFLGRTSVNRKFKIFRSATTYKIPLSQNLCEQAWNSNTQIDSWKHMYFFSQAVKKLHLKIQVKLNF